MHNCFGPAMATQSQVFDYHNVYKLSENQCKGQMVERCRQRDARGPDPVEVGAHSRIPATPACRGQGNHLRVAVISKECNEIAAEPLISIRVRYHQGGPICLEQATTRVLVSVNSANAYLMHAYEVALSTTYRPVDRPRMQRPL
jgi:hypothetical protein